MDGWAAAFGGIAVSNRGRDAVVAIVLMCVPLGRLRAYFATPYLKISADG